MNLNNFEPELESPRGLVKNHSLLGFTLFFIQWKGPHEFVVLTKFQVMLMLPAGPGTKSHCIDKCCLHKWETLLKNFNVPEAFLPVCNVQKLEFWATEKNPDFSLVSILYKVKDSGQLETDLLSLLNLITFSSTYQLYSFLIQSDFCLLEFLNVLFFFKKTVWYCFDSWSFMPLEEVWLPSKLFILISLFTCCI